MIADFSARDWSSACLMHATFVFHCQRGQIAVKAVAWILANIPQNVKSTTDLEFPG